MSPPMKQLLACVAALVLGASAAHAAMFTAVQTYDEQTSNLYTITGEAPNNNINAAAFGTLVSDAFTAGAGGVWDFEEGPTDSSIGTNYDIKFNGGNSTLNIVSNANDHSTLRNGVPAWGATGISGSLHFGGNPQDFTFTFDTGLTAFGITAVSRTTEQTIGVSVRLADNTLVSLGEETLDSTGGTGTTFDPGVGANWDPTNIFFGYQATSANPIVSVEFAGGDDFVRYDDLGFVVVPEPATALVGLALVGMLGLRRRPRRTA